MSYVNWQLKEDILVGTVNATNIPDDQSACQVTEDLQDGVSTHVLRGGAAATGTDTKVLVDFAALDGAPASLATRIGQLSETWHDLNIELKLCDLPYEVLEAFEATGTDRLVKIYDNQRDALAAFNGEDVSTVTTTTAKTPEKQAPPESSLTRQRDSSKVGQIILTIRAVAAVVSDSIVIRLRRHLQNSKVVRIAVALLVVGVVLAGSIVIWQYSTTARYKTVSVSGTLRMDGQPLSGFTVMFEPIGSNENPYPGPSSYGVTNSSGEFSLKTITNDQAGAVVGNHRVRLVKAKEGEQDLFSNPNVLPSQYNVSTELTYLVPPEGTNKAAFDLKSEIEESDVEKSEME